MLLSTIGSDIAAFGIATSSSIAINIIAFVIATRTTIDVTIARAGAARPGGGESSKGIPAAAAAATEG